MKDHVTFMGSHKNVGLTIIDFKRSIMPHDSADAPIPMEGPCQVCDLQPIYLPSRTKDNLFFGSKHNRKIAIVLGLLMVQKLT